MSTYGILGDLVKAHHEQLLREAAIARGFRHGGRFRKLPSALHRLLFAVLS